MQPFRDLKSGGTEALRLVRGHRGGDRFAKAEPAELVEAALHGPGRQRGTTGLRGHASDARVAVPRTDARAFGPVGHQR